MSRRTPGGTEARIHCDHHLSESVSVIIIITSLYFSHILCLVTICPKTIVVLFLRNEGLLKDTFKGHILLFRCGSSEILCEFQIDFVFNQTFFEFSLISAWEGSSCLRGTEINETLFSRGGSTWLQPQDLPSTDQ